MKQEEPRDAFEALDVIAADSTDRPTKRQVETVAKDAKKSGHRAIAVGVAFAIVISLLSFGAARVASRETARVESKVVLYDSAIESLREANDKLIAKGIAPIPLPEDGNAIDANALAQAAAALVLADPRFAGLTLADLRRQVDDYFREHPLPEGQKPTTEQVTTAVAGIYAANPPKPGEQGRPPTASEIAAGVSSYCAGGACKGEKGDAGDNGINGKDAKDPTQDQVNAAVRSYCDNPPGICASDEPGPKGDPGQTVKPVSAQFSTMEVEPGCYYVTTYSDGTRIVAPAPVNMCSP